MTFISYGFFLLFLPISFLLYWYAFKQQNSRLVLLLLVNYVFYVLIGSYYVFLLFVLGIVTFYFAKKRWTILGIILNLVPLLLYKVIGSFNYSGGFLSDGFSILIPLGISYFTFKHIGYLIDVHQNRLEPSQNLLLFLAFSSFFSQIVAGPISKYDDTAPQLIGTGKSLSSQAVMDAITFISFGIFKKLIIGDTLATFISTEMAHIERSSVVWGWGILVIFILQVYFDFSGYSDIALGIGYLFGIKLPDNFNNPLLSDSPREFWNRWHISLSYWFRYYFYFPVSRNLMRKFGRKYIELIEYSALSMTMILIGIWHNLTIGFFLWGLYNGLLLSLQSWGEKRRVHIYPDSFKTIFSLISIIFGFSFLIHSEYSSILEFQIGLLGANGMGSLSMDSVPFYAAITALCLVLTGRTEAANINWNNSKIGQVLAGVLLVISILHLGGEAITFVYARF